MNKEKIGKTRYTYGIAIRSDKFLLEVSKSRPVPLNVVRDVALEVLNLGRPAFKERVEDYFLCRLVKCK